MMDTHFLVLAAGGGIDDFVQAAAGSPEVSYFLVEAPEGIVGYLPRNSVLELVQKTRQRGAGRPGGPQVHRRERRIHTSRRMIRACRGGRGGAGRRRRGRLVGPESGGLDHQRSDRQCRHRGAGCFRGLSGLACEPEGCPVIGRQLRGRRSQPPGNISGATLITQTTESLPWRICRDETS